MMNLTIVLLGVCLLILGTDAWGKRGTNWPDKDLESSNESPEHNSHTDMGNGIKDAEDFSAGDNDAENDVQISKSFEDKGAGGNWKGRKHMGRGGRHKIWHKNKQHKNNEQPDVEKGDDGTEQAIVVLEENINEDVVGVGVNGKVSDNFEFQSETDAKKKKCVKNKDKAGGRKTTGMHNDGTKKKWKKHEWKSGPENKHAEWKGKKTNDGPSKQKNQDQSNEESHDVKESLVDLTTEPERKTEAEEQENNAGVGTFSQHDAGKSAHKGKHKSKQDKSNGKGGQHKQKKRKWKKKY